MATSKIRNLKCACCGGYTRGRQWFNQDTGYGLCVKCADWIATRETQEMMDATYGKRGESYDIKEGE